MITVIVFIAYIHKGARLIFLVKLHHFYVA